MLKLSCVLPCSPQLTPLPALASLLSSVAFCSSKIQVLAGAEGGMLNCPQTGGFWFVIAGKYILSQVLPGSHVGLSPWGEPAVSWASPERLAVFILGVTLQRVGVWTGVAQGHRLYQLLSIPDHVQCVHC